MVELGGTKCARVMVGMNIHDYDMIEIVTCFSVTGKAILDTPSNLLIDEIIYFILLLFKTQRFGGQNGKKDQLGERSCRCCGSVLGRKHVG